MSCKVCVFGYQYDGNVFEVTCKRFPQHVSKSKDQVCGEFIPWQGHDAYQKVLDVGGQAMKRIVILEERLAATRKELDQLKRR